MSKKDKTFRVWCGYEGCNESGFYSYDNTKEYQSLDKRFGNGRWRCVRHTHSEDVLSINNLKTEKTLIAIKSIELNQLFWDNKSGFIYGDGYKAYANDFPEGTQLKVTAEIILPEIKK